MFYPIPNHRLPSFATDADLPETERAARECLSLPVHPSVSQADLERIVAAVNSAREGRCLMAARCGPASSASG